jgi:NAD(P)-dependent dehydrogenase (short-subunit alcohol dehydrogenase family)
MSNDRSMKGSRVLVTGGASGLGLAIAHALQEQEARVAIADVNREVLDRVAAGKGLFPVTMDVSSAGSVQTCIEATLKELGGLDCLVNSAGVIQFRLMREMSEGDWDRTLDINLKGVFLTCRAATPHLCQSKRGRIVSIASDAGKKGFPLISAYCASKFGLIGFSKAIAGELAPFGVTVNCVCPTGVTNTGMGQEVLDYLAAASGKDRSAIVASRSAGIPLGRMGTPDDVTQAVLFLLSDAASFITGEAINVDGGVLSTGVVPGADTGASA